MYTIRRNNRRFGTKTFMAYNEARQYLRRWIRKHVPLWQLDHENVETSNPNISFYGFEIKSK